ncbi:hypothetical protein GGF50DRAFT_66832, partial [Schizophyllum commune]
ITQLRSGHIGYTNAFLARIKANTSSLCPLCGVPETVDHYLFSCRRFVLQTGEVPHPQGAPRQCPALCCSPRFCSRYRPLLIVLGSRPLLRTALSLYHPPTLLPSSLQPLQICLYASFLSSYLCLDRLAILSLYFSLSLPGNTPSRRSRLEGTPPC